MTFQPRQEEELLDLSQFAVKDKPFQDVQREESFQIQEEPLNLEQFQVEQDPTFLQNLGSAAQEAFRFSARNTATALAAVGGIPGNTVQAAKFISSKLPKVPDFLKGDETFVTEIGRNVLESLPTTEDISDFTSNLTRGFTDPKNALEEFGDDVIDLGVTLAVGNKDPTKFRKLVNPLTKALTAKGVRVGLEQLGADEKIQLGGELSTLFLMSLMDQKFANKYISEKYDAARAKLPEGAVVSTTTLETQLDALDRELSKGISTASKDEVRNALNELKAKASGGAMEAEEIIQSYHDINERMTSRKLFDDLSKQERGLLKRRYDSLRKVVNDSVAEIGEANPEFFKEWKEANQAFGTIKESKKVSNFISKATNKLPKTVQFGLAHTLFNPKAAAALGAGGAAVTTGELIFRIAKSPTLRKHYLNTLTAATNENLPAFIRNLEKLDKDLQDDFENEFYIQEQE